MTYTFNSDLSWMMLVAQWHIAGQSWAEIASKVNKPAHELEELPFRHAEQWVAALSQMMVITQQEASLKALQQIQATIATTTEPKTLAALVTALTRLLKVMSTKQHDSPNHPSKLKPEPIAPPPPTSGPSQGPNEPTPIPTEVHEKLSAVEMTRFVDLRKQFTDFGQFLQEFPKREPVIFRKLQANNLLPKNPPLPFQATG